MTMMMIGAVGEVSFRFWFRFVGSKFSRELEVSGSVSFVRVSFFCSARALLLLLLLLLPLPLSNALAWWWVVSSEKRRCSSRRRRFSG
jgi:hypothetical protein